MPKPNLKAQMRAQLLVLKQKILTPRVIASKDFFGFGKRLQFALGLLLPRHWGGMIMKLVAGGAAVVIVLGSLPLLNRGADLKRQVLGTATSGFDFLNGGKSALLGNDFSGASESLLLAADSFGAAREQVETGLGLLSPLLTVLPQGRDLDSMLTAGASASRALSGLALAVEDFRAVRPVMSDQSLYKRLKATAAQLTESEKELEAALAALSAVNPNSVPPEYREQLLTGGRQLAAGSGALRSMLVFQNMMLQLLGGRDKTYLMVFQNNAEVRATGGFLGTYGLLSFKNGTMAVERIESIYVLDGQLTSRIAPPAPMQRHLTDTWGIRDSNWFADFPQSARKMLGFLEEEAGVAADGVISFTPDVFERLLTLTGPVPMPEYGETLTAENFRAVTQKQTSLLYDRQLNQPKKFLAEFASRLLQKFENLDEERWLELLEVLSKSAEEKHVLMFSLDPDIQSAVRGSGAAGEVRETVGDYLQIVHSNLGGGKTDLGIAQSVQKTVTIDARGRAVVDLRITRTHKAYDEKFFPKNLDYMRIMVPEGSALLAVSGFENGGEVMKPAPAGAEADPDVALWERGLRPAVETGSVVIGHESGYSFFAGWLDLEPGQSKTVEVSYALPFAVDKKYTHLLQKQSGAALFEFSLTIVHPWETTSIVYPDSMTSVNGRLEIAEKVATDRFYGVLGE